MVSRVAGTSAAAALLLFLVARRWDGRLSVALNFIFLFVGAPNFSAVCDDADPAMAAHVEKLRKKHAKGMAPLPTVEVGAVEFDECFSRNSVWTRCFPEFHVPGVFGVRSL